MKKTGYDVVNLDILSMVQSVHVPALFIVASDDVITPPQKVQSIFNMYNGAPKRLILVDGEHHTERAKFDLACSNAFVEENIGFVFERDSIEPDLNPPPLPISPKMSKKRDGDERMRSLERNSVHSF